MEEDKTKKNWKRKRRNAMQPEEDILELEEEKEIVVPVDRSREIGRTQAAADYKIMEELIEDPVKEERERRRRAVEKWTKESNAQFVRGLAKYGKKFRKVAEPLQDDITVADCVEHYYMAKPFRFDFEKWRAQEKINEERSLALSLEERQGTSSKEVAQTSKSPTDPQPTSVEGEELDDIETEKPEEKLELPVSKPIVIEIKDGPEVIVIE